MFSLAHAQCSCNVGVMKSVYYRTASARKSNVAWLWYSESERMLSKSSLYLLLSFMHIPAWLPHMVFSVLTQSSNKTPSLWNRIIMQHGTPCLSNELEREMKTAKTLFLNMSQPHDSFLQFVLFSLPSEAWKLSIRTWGYDFIIFHSIQILPYTTGGLCSSYGLIFIFLHLNDKIITWMIFPLRWSFHWRYLLREEGYITIKALYVHLKKLIASPKQENQILQFFLWQFFLLVWKNPSRIVPSDWLEQVKFNSAHVKKLS